jgi:hypothetical protein
MVSGARNRRYDGRKLWGIDVYGWDTRRSGDEGQIEWMNPGLACPAVVGRTYSVAFDGKENLREPGNRLLPVPIPLQLAD